MHKKVIIGAILAIVVVAGIWIVSKQVSQEKMQTKNSMMKDEVKMEADKKAESEATEEKPAVESNVIMQEAGKYEAYDASKLAFAKEGKAVLFFRASWCPTCRALDANIKANAEDIPSDVTIFDVNYDTAGDLKSKYGVISQHTLVQVDESGNQITQWIGSPSLSDLLTKVK